MILMIADKIIEPGNVYISKDDKENKELFEELNKHNTKPKVKQKIRNELTRRSITIVKRTQNG